jgi:signal transduction histidine kinase
VSGRHTAMLGLAAAAGAALVAAVAARRGPEWALAGDSVARLAVELGAGLVLALCALALRRREGDLVPGALMLAAATAWAIVEWSNPRAPGALVFTAGLVFAAAVPALVVDAALVHARGRAGRRLAVVAAYVAGIGLVGLVPAMTSSPRDTGCQCPADLVQVVDAPGVSEWAERWGLLASAVALAACGALALVALWQANPARRRAVAPVVLPALAFVGIAVAGQVHGFADGELQSDVTAQDLRLAGAIAALAVAGGVLWRAGDVRRARARLAAVVVEMAGAPVPGQLAERLGAALGDPSLELLHAVDEGWVDADGHARSAGDEGPRGRTALVQDGQVAALVLHRHGLLDDPRLVEELGRAARLALDNERLRAQLLASVERLRAARALLVAAADEERARLERDLHDGAQQGLAGLAMAIGLASASASGPRAAQLALARDRVRAALDAVRTVAHAIYPAALRDAGLGAALDVLAEWREDIDVQARLAGPANPTVEANAYFIVAALTESGTGPAAVDAERQDGTMVLEVSTPDPGDLVEIRDRVGALGGRLDVDSDGGERARVRVELPCE